MTKPRKIKSKRKYTPLRNEFLELTVEPQDPSPLPSLDWETEQRCMVEEARAFKELQEQVRRHRRAMRPSWMLDSFIGGCLFLMICLVLGRRPK